MEKNAFSMQRMRENARIQPMGDGERLEAQSPVPFHHFRRGLLHHLPVPRHAPDHAPGRHGRFRRSLRHRASRPFLGMGHAAIHRHRHGLFFSEPVHRPRWRRRQPDAAGLARVVPVPGLEFPGVHFFTSRRRLAWGWLICGVVFVLMGGLPLLLAFKPAREKIKSRLQSGAGLGPYLVAMAAGCRRDCAGHLFFSKMLSV